MEFSGGEDRALKESTQNLKKEENNEKYATKTVKINMEQDIVVFQTPAKPEDHEEELVHREAKNTSKLDIDEHLLHLDQIGKKYSTEINLMDPTMSKGLTNAKAAELLVEYGRNEIPPPKRRHPFLIFMDMLKNPLTSLLLFCGFLSLILYALDDTHDPQNLYLGAILVVVTFLNSYIEFVQLQKSAAILDSFKSLIPQMSLVIREGVKRAISASELVIGDIIYIQEGDKVPADCRIIFSKEVKVDYSSLTGESEPQERMTETEKVNPMEAENLAFYGTLMVSGQAYGVVIRTGAKTVLGQIANLAGGDKKIKSPLSKEIEAVVKIIAVAAIVMGVFFFIIGMIINPQFTPNFIFFIGIFVANIPQGLPATVTLLLTFAAKRLAKLNVLVKDLQGVDTLGSITLLASDKTGTMTQNKMTVVNIWSSCQYFTMPEQKLLDVEYHDFSIDFPGLRLMVDLACLCSKAIYDNTPQNMSLPPSERKIIADATEKGLLKFAANYVDFEKERIQKPKVFEIPFNSHNKWALSIHAIRNPTSYFTLFIKGAPERLLQMCSHIYINGVEEELNEESKKNFDEAYISFASQGQRVLGFAFSLLPKEQYPENFKFEEAPLNGFCFLGLVGIIDPPKAKVAQAVASCQTAGIQVMMVTGDHPLTAEAIARQVGLLIGETKEQVAKKLGKPLSAISESQYRAVVVHGDKIDELTGEDWDNILSKKEVVFARTSPKHKLEIVARCQARGHVVAVTGDGVNDSPALKRADLGISMGISGSDVSKEAANMILMDDNFATVVEGIAQGRLIFVNLKKSIMYTLTHIFPEIVPFLLYIILGFPLALSSILVLFIDLGTELFPALSLAWEPEEGDLMKSSPRKQVVPPPNIVVSGSEVTNLTRVRSFHVEEIVDHGPKKKWWQVVKFPQRNPGDEGLVDSRLLLWSYMQAGVIETLGGFGCFFCIYGMAGISASDLIGLGRDVYDTSRANDYCEGIPFSQCTPDKVTHSASEMQNLLAESQAAYFLSIVVCQFFVLFACKIKNGLPIGKQLFRNKRSFIAILMGAVYASILIYTPGLNYVLGAYPVRPIILLIPAGAGVVVILYEIVRKILLKRGYFGGFQGQQKAQLIEGIQRTLTRGKSGKNV